MNPPVCLVSEAVVAAMLDKAVGTPPGAFVEVGVFQGGTAVHLYGVAKTQKRALYLYDTFTGIPYKSDVDVHPVGDFADCNVEDVRRLCPDAVVVPGVFPASAIPMGDIAFVHLDCDQYRSYHEAIDYLLPKMLPGGVMWFDDSPCLPGALKAVTECFGSRLKLSEHKHYVEV